MTRIHSIIFLAFLWTGWCFLHSLLITRGFTEKMKAKMGRLYAYYRLSYNVFSLVTVVPLMYFQLHLKAVVIFAWPWPWNIVKYGMYGASFFLFYGGYLVYDLRYMLGIRQIKQVEHGGKKGAAQLTTKGILGYVRHPWYSGAILLVWAFADISDVSLVSKVVLTVYLIIGTLLEERKLMGEFGEQYRIYSEKVGMLIPKKKQGTARPW